MKVIKEVQVVSELVKMFPDMMDGGQWRPRNCTARDRVAIVIPYRNREQHLYILLRNLHPMLHRQQIDYGIFVIEQAGKFCKHFQAILYSEVISKEQQVAFCQDIEGLNGLIFTLKMYQKYCSGSCSFPFCCRQHNIFTRRAELWCIVQYIVYNIVRSLQ